MDKPKFVRTDILNKLKSLHAGLETTKPEDAKVVIEEAIHTIRTLRDLIGIRDEILLEDVPAEGHG